jgi:hypothetical protein
VLLEILIENMSDGTVDRLGVGYSTISKVNPRIVIARSPASNAPPASKPVSGGQGHGDHHSGVERRHGYDGLR